MRFASRSRSIFCGNRSRKSKIYDCSRWEKNAVFPDRQEALANHTRRSPTTIFRRFRVGASIDAPGTTPPRGIPSTKGRKARRDRPYRLDSLAKGRLTFPPAPNGDARLANDAAIGSRTSGRRSTPRFLAVKRRPARRDERPRAFVRAPRRRSVATPARALLRGARDTRTTAGTTDRAIGSTTAHLAATTIGAIAIGG